MSLERRLADLERRRAPSTGRIRDIERREQALFEAARTEDPEGAARYLEAVDDFWRAGAEHGRDSREARQASRRFQRARHALFYGGGL